MSNANLMSAGNVTPLTPNHAPTPQNPPVVYSVSPLNPHHAPTPPLHPVVENDPMAVVGSVDNTYTFVGEPGCPPLVEDAEICLSVKKHIMLTRDQVAKLASTLIIALSHGLVPEQQKETLCAFVRSPLFLQPTALFQHVLNNFIVSLYADLAITLDRTWIDNTHDFGFGIRFDIAALAWTDIPRERSQAAFDAYIYHPFQMYLNTQAAEGSAQ